MSDNDDELGRHIGTLWRTAMAGLDTTREVVMRSMQSGRLRVDIALLQKERGQLLEALGEIVMGLVDDGSFEDVPESVKQTYDRVKDVEGRLKNDTIRAHDNAFGAPRGFEPEAASDYGEDDEVELLVAERDKGRSSAGSASRTGGNNGSAVKKPKIQSRKKPAARRRTTSR